ncbi:MAG: hypothetical protein ACKOZL_03195 [Actinomycetes bacterium]
MSPRVIEHLNIVWNMIAGDVGAHILRLSAQMLGGHLVPAGL